MHTVAGDDPPGLEGPLGGWHPGERRIPADSVPQGAGNRLEDRLYLVVRIFAVERFDVQVAPGMFGERVPEVLDHLDGKISYPIAVEICLVMQIETPGQIDGSSGEGVVHRYVRMPEAANECFVAQGFAKSVSQRDGHILDSVMFVYMQIAVTEGLQSESSVLCEQVEHVVQKPDACFILVRCFLIEPQLDAYAGFRSFADHGGATRVEIAG